MERRLFDRFGMRQHGLLPLGRVDHGVQGKSDSVIGRFLHEIAQFVTFSFGFLPLFDQLPVFERAHSVNENVSYQRQVDMILTVLF